MWETKKKKMMEDNRKAMKKLIIVLIISLIFSGVEIAGGLYSHSIAILSDAAHLLSDVLGFGVSVWAIHYSQNNRTEKYTFGFHRAEILGSLVSIFTIWGITGYLLDEAIHRFLNPDKAVVQG